MTKLPNLDHLSHAEKDALIHALWAQVQALTARVTELEAKLGEPPKNSDNSSQPPSRDKKPNRDDKAKRQGPRQGSLGRKGISGTITHNLTLTGVGGMAHMSATVNIPNGKALLIVGKDDTSTAIVTINNFEFSNAIVASGNNGAGIRYQGGDLFLNGCYFHDNANGILGGDTTATGAVTISNSEFYNNGIGDGLTHNIYLILDTPATGLLQC